jgi:hypothetical protein
MPDNAKFRIPTSSSNSMNGSESGDKLQLALQKLLDNCQANDWAGYDPYDALNSRLFKALPILDSRIPRLVLTQGLKRLPFNLRPILAIPKTQNPKGLALFLSAFTKIARSGTEDPRKTELLMAHMIERIGALRSPNQPYSCWGYSFPWQTRTIIVPSGFPNLVCTTFVANALLDAYELCGNEECFKMALSAAQYILAKLFWTADGSAGFSYPHPSVRNQVHNANFLAACLLARTYSHTRDEQFLHPALQVARQSAARQQANGSWYYGEAQSQRWIDNFHTGYNLCALLDLSNYVGTEEFDSVIGRGFMFYRNHFFTDDGSARYFHDSTYPIDIHSVAQSIITLVRFRNADRENLILAQTVFDWAVKHLWDKRGFFYYRVLRSYTNRVSFMRWSQAWMALAMVTLAEASQCDRIEERGDLAYAGRVAQR